MHFAKPPDFTACVKQPRHFKKLLRLNFKYYQGFAETRGFVCTQHAEFLKFVGVETPTYKNFRFLPKRTASIVRSCRALRFVGIETPVPAAFPDFYRNARLRHHARRLISTQYKPYGAASAEYFQISEGVILRRDF